MNLRSFLLFSEHPDQLVDFYSQVFVMKPGWNGGNFQGFKIGEGYMIIGSHNSVRGNNLVPERMMFNIETDRYDEEYERIKNIRGITLIQETYHPGEDQKLRISTFSDPDGNYFQLTTVMQTF